MLQNIFEYLGTVFGVSTILVVAVIVFWNKILDPAYNKFLEYLLEKEKMQKKMHSDLTLENAKISEKAHFDLEIELAKIREKSIADLQDRLVSKRLEIETIKLNRVLPALEEISIAICDHLVQYNTYLYYVSNKGLVEQKGYEEDRVKIDTQMLSNINKISMYLPSEMRVLLIRIRFIISCSYKDSLGMWEYINNSDFSHQEVWNRAMEIYNSYRECFYEMAYNYCSINNDELSFAVILEKHNLNSRGIKNQMDLLDKFVHCTIFMHEYDVGLDKSAVHDESFLKFNKTLFGNNLTQKEEE